MRKLLLITAIVLLTTSALAGPRGLSASPPAEPQKPFRQAEVTILPAPGEQPAATTTTKFRHSRCTKSSRPRAN